ncbi:Phosphoadenylyl-sulfate reductase (thioredoxin) [Saliniradius amylolyticus]|uniref:Phosphoadenosine 5'-phosphosulfate reductase n=1 Tax=Saliniradius amylolyticus TaxID=2183582 RepID=A0A2S2E4C3_9ALTE|nr:phosphoadenylyl-sulfate reductase [Saliniradius amylolyticus]AWL12494.1 Phosphoadenylyl-sulfate reductase (thioredoxin) [Saliniradius amylolyticus]
MTNNGVQLSSVSQPVSQQWLAEANKQLERMSASERVAWALANLPDKPMLSSSFGIQAAVMLHMVTRQMPEIPVVLTDTGYLFPETYDFIEELTQSLDLNLKTYSAHMTPVWQEHKYGQLWEQGVEGLEAYNRMNKVEPMQRALKELQVGTWFSGLRRSQSSSRSDLPFVQLVDGRVKVFPILDWTNKDVHYYLKDHGLPYHPLWDQGYVSVGDWHTSRPLEAGMSEEETRFFGLKRECGLHEFGDGI